MARDVAGELLLVPLGVQTSEATHRAADLYLVNGTGRLIWDALSEARSREELIRHLVETCEVDEHTAAADLDMFLKDLTALGAVTVTQGDAWT
jgi:hypothetical protein